MTMIFGLEIMNYSVMFQMTRGALVSSGGEKIEVTEHGYHPSKAIRLTKRAHFHTIHLVKENIDIRWDGGRVHMKSIFLSLSCVIA